ncbi:MAG TPA: tetratricopeptide repeat protein [bacterium]|nr:tetratricopeptide repeat protein [bacterium]HPJ72238.1 tetratricopeptide repeat protein [bacterium]HPQ65396.1 tetratricopeptide repeat protein [bacterium]
MKSISSAILVALALGFLGLRPPPARAQEDSDYYADYEDGKDLFYAGEYDKARRKFENVLDQRDNHRGANQYLGRIYLKEKNYSKAIKYLEDCLKETTGDYRKIPLSFLAEAYEGAGNRRKALSTWQEYLRYADPGSEWEQKAKDRIKALGGTI